MKTVGLITEYNPFHNGHLYHIEKAKELCIIILGTLKKALTTTIFPSVY